MATLAERRRERAWCVCEGVNLFHDQLVIQAGIRRGRRLRVERKAPAQDALQVPAPPCPACQARVTEAGFCTMRVFFLLRTRGPPLLIPEVLDLEKDA